jgi:hypothetical protein
MLVESDSLTPPIYICYTQHRCYKMYTAHIYVITCTQHMYMLYVHIIYIYIYVVYTTHICILYTTDICYDTHTHTYTYIYIYKHTKKGGDGGKSPRVWGAVP